MLNKGIRILNFLIDTLAVSITYATMDLIIGQRPDSNLLILVCFFLYYFLFESITGRTLGKMITKTIVVDTNNSTPTLFRIILRTILRFNPFDWMSFIFGSELGAHDQFSKTKLIFTKNNPQN